MGDCQEARRLDPGGLLSLPVQCPLPLPRATPSILGTSRPSTQLAQAGPVSTGGKGWAGPPGSTRATCRSAPITFVQQGRPSLPPRDLLGGGGLVRFGTSFPLCRKGLPRTKASTGAGGG